MILIFYSNSFFFCFVNSILLYYYFTARFTMKEKYILFYIKANKVTLRKRKSKEINNYLNTKANINNISCFNQVATIFNLEKTFDSFFNSKLTTIVYNVNFLELEYNLVEKLLLMPRHEEIVRCVTNDGIEFESFVDPRIKKQVSDAAEDWLDHKIEEREKHEKILFAKVLAALQPVAL